VTFTASYHKVFRPNPRVGFLAHAQQLVRGAPAAATARLIFNDRLDAAVTGILIVMIGVIVLESGLGWARF